MKSFRDKLALITGGSSGIGLACAEALVREGAAVCIIARRSKPLKAAVAHLRTIAPAAGAGPKNNQRIVGFSADVASYRQLKSAYRKCRRDLGVPHLLINCAGFSKPGRFAELPLHQFYRQTETNYYGAVHGAKMLLSDWIARGDGGAIVNVASVAGYLGVYGFSAYSPTKFAVLGFSESLRQELKVHGLRVHVACPPDTDTPGLRAENEGKPPETVALSGKVRPVSADRVAASILAGVRRNRFMIFADFESRFVYAISRWFPGLTRRIMDGIVSRSRNE
ncbi:MAG: SDR family oxidoreductase [bacterium]|nr:SDR family oxidoreductase [bacterium]